MSWFTDLFRPEKHDATPPITMFGFPAGVGVTTSVTSTASFALSGVWGALRVIRDGVSQLDWRETRGTLDLPLSRLARRPEAAWTRREWTMRVTETLALFDVCHLLKIGELDDDGPQSLMYIPPQAVTPATPADVYGLAPISEYWIGQRKVPADALVILRTGLHPGIPDHLAGVLNLARVKFAEALSAENYGSRFWQAGASPITVLTSDQPLTETQAEDIANRWATRRQQGPDVPAVLGLGAQAKPFGADLTAEAAVEARREMTADIARYFGIPTRLLNAPTSDTETYTASGDSNLDLLRFSLQNYIDAICDGISDQLPGRRRISMDTTQLTRGSQLARYQAWQLATGGQRWMRPEDVREEEHMVPLEPADLVALNPPAPEPTGKLPQGAAPAQLTAPRVG